MSHETSHEQPSRSTQPEMFTVVYEPFHNLPAPPYALPDVTLDGADTALVGYVRGLDLTDQASVVAALAIGTRVAVRFTDEPTGTAADYWFEPAPAAGRLT